MSTAHAIAINAQRVRAHHDRVSKWHSLLCGEHIHQGYWEGFDYVLTVCDNAKESCPLFPGKTVTIHRSFEDPTAMQGSEEERFAVLRRVRDEIRDYLRELTNRAAPEAAPESKR